MNRYGQLPKVIDHIECESKEMLFYQDMPIKMSGVTECTFEPRLKVYHEVISKSINDFIEQFGIVEYKKRYVYICAKYLFQKKQNSFNRDGWHCDGFMSNDITYVWSDVFPTVFNNSNFNLTQDHNKSIEQMSWQAIDDKNICFGDNKLVRLDQYNVHKVAEVAEDGMRAFVKVSFSKDKFDLIGNTHNHLLNYNWEMKPRSEFRNVPQSIVSSTIDSEVTNG